MFLKRSFAEDPTLSPKLFDLLETTFPGISQTAQLIQELGQAWESVSTPFMYFQAEQAISHVGVLEIPLTLMGRPINVGAIHGVCTHPAYRRQGYYRKCMESALDYCKTRYETLVLTAAQPEFYSPFGFRVLKEHAFVTKCSPTRKTNEFRILNLTVPGDRALLNRLLDERQPVSNIVGVRGEKAVFCFNEASRPLYYAAGLDLMVVMEINGDQLHLYDIVGDKPCKLACILERIPQPIEKTIIYFNPDRLDVSAQPFPHLLEGDSYLMVKGPFIAETQAFMLPHSARC